MISQALLAVVVATAPSLDTRIVLESRDGSLSERRLAGLEIRDLREVGAAWIRFADARPSTPDEQGEAGASARVELVSGDVLRGRVIGGAEEEITLELVEDLELPVSIESMRSLVFPSRLPLAGASSLAAPEEGDRLYRRIADNLDRIDGAVEEFTPEGIRFESVLGSRLFAWSEVGALFVETFDEGEDEERDGKRIVCDLVDGSRVRGSLERLDRSGLRLRALGGSSLLLPVDVLSEIALDDGSVAFLSDMNPTAADEGSPFGDDLGASWPHRMDRSVMGRPLVANGRVFNRGIGVHSPSRLTFALDGRWNELRGLVAIDDDVLRLPERGSVTFRVLVDGEMAWESPVVRGGTPPVAIPPVALDGARELVLECDMAVDFAVADRADWLRMVLVRDE